MASKQTMRDPMLKIMGDYPEGLPRSEENLTLRFSPSKTSIQQRWRNNGLSADFIADYLMTFFLGTDQEENAGLLLELKASTAYISNELLENAMKYNDESSNQAIVFSLNLYPDQLVFLTANSIRMSQIDGFQSYIQELLDEDPEEMYFNKLLDEDETGSNSKGSGLGLLTMINQHQARLGWKFERVEVVDPTPPLVTTVTTSVCLPIGSALTIHGTKEHTGKGTSNRDGN